MYNHSHDLSVWVGCDDSRKSSIPSMAFSFSCNPGQYPYSKITTPDQFLLVNKDVHGLRVGYGGLIIGQSVFEPGTYTAFDAACPVEANRNVVVDLQEDGSGKAICPECHTVYDLNNYGFPTGEGTEYLKRYPVASMPNPVGMNLVIRN